jgi:hypothetical protein
MGETTVTTGDLRLGTGDWRLRTSSCTQAGTSRTGL